MSEIIKNDKKIVNAWCMYDWANSVYPLTITTAIFPAFYIGVTGGEENSLVRFFGIELENTALYAFAVSAAYLLVALMNPFLSSIADYTGNKKVFMKFFCYLGALSCSGLFFFNGENIEYGIILFALAGIGYAGSLVFYNSYLPEIATEDKFDNYSAKGFSLGYIGSVILLIVNLLVVLFPNAFSIPEEDTRLPAQLCFLTVGIWWAGFAQITFSRMPNPIKREKQQVNVIQKGLEELSKVWQEIKQQPIIKKYLLGYFLYSTGVQTVMYMATIFGEKVIGFEESSSLIFLILIIQLVAIPGAFLFSWISKKKGNFYSIILAVIVWIGICISAYFMGHGMETEFYILAVIVGVVMGAIQSMSRSTYSKLIPTNTKDTASYFSFFELVEKVAITLGTLVYGTLVNITGSDNYSALALGVFFIASLVVLMRLPKLKTA